MKEYCVYIMSNLARTLYVGVTNDLERRVYEHKRGLVEGFTKRYSLTMLVYFEATDDVGAAIEQEKRIKGWLRSKKVALVESENPDWKDLSEDWYDADTIVSPADAEKRILRSSQRGGTPSE